MGNFLVINYDSKDLYKIDRRHTGGNGSGECLT